MLAGLTLSAQTTERRLDYVIGSRDLIEVKVFQDPTMNGQLRVSEEGRVSLPLIGAVEVAGLTPSQAQARIKGKLEERYMTRADVTVFVVQFENQPISVIGSVNKPGKIPVTGSISLLQAISQAGGLAEGHGGSLYILRTSSNGLSDQLEIKLDDLMVRGDAELNIPVAPNDIINVPAEVTVTIYVLGEVMKQAPVLFKESQKPTLLKAIAGAGGLTDRASRGDIVIKRRVAGKETSIRVNIGRVLRGKSEDPVLMDNDTVFVRESFL